jgi:hypothetical protein
MRARSERAHAFLMASGAGFLMGIALPLAARCVGRQTPAGQFSPGARARQRVGPRHARFAARGSGPASRL